MDTMQIHSAADIIAIGEAWEKEMAQAIYIKGDCVVLNVLYEYEIELSRIKSHEALLKWVYHLSGKEWMTKDHLVYFMDLIMKINQLSYPHETG